MLYSKTMVSELGVKERLVKTNMPEVRQQHRMKILKKIHGAIRQDCEQVSDKLLRTLK